MTYLYSHADFRSFGEDGHPESALRIAAVESRIATADFHDALQKREPRKATIGDLLLVHTEAYIELIRSLSEGNETHYLCPETPVGPSTFDMSLWAAGAVIQAVDDVLSAGPGANAFCLVRPPGHHACSARGMGHCIFNNEAVGARYATTAHSLKRILIVDWDLHHANGTQDVFYSDPAVYLLSIHRRRTYHYAGQSGIGAASETGGGLGIGTMFNVPVERSVSRHAYLERFENTLHTAAERCQPQLVIVSGGFDAHCGDPVGDLRHGLHTEDFRLLTRLVLDVAETFASGRVISVLEGGYEPAPLSECVMYCTPETGQVPYCRVPSWIRRQQSCPSDASSRHSSRPA